MFTFTFYLNVGESDNQILCELVEICGLLLAEFVALIYSNNYLLLFFSF